MQKVFNHSQAGGVSPDRYIKVRAYLERLTTGEGSPEININDILGALSDEAGAVEHHSSSDSNQGNNQKIINDLRQLTNLCGCSDIFELAGQVGSLLSEVNDRIPAWMSTNIAQDVCYSMMLLVVDLEIFSDILEINKTYHPNQLKNSLYADFCEGALSDNTIKSFSESVKTILEDLVPTEQQGLVQLLDLSLAPLEKKLVATHGELSFMKQAISDQVNDSAPVMNLAFSPQIAVVFSDLEKFLEKHLTRLENGETIDPNDKVFRLNNSIINLLRQRVAEAPIEEKRLVQLAGIFASQFLGEEYSTFYQWKAFRKGNGKELLNKTRIYLDGNRLSDEQIINLFAPIEDYRHLEGKFIFEPSEESNSITKGVLTARVKSKLSLAEKLFSVILDNLSLQQNWTKYYVNLGKKTNGAARWICDQYGIMFVTPDAADLINSHINDINDGSYPGLTLLRDEQTTAKNGFKTRKIIVKYNPDDNEDEGQATQKKGSSVPSTTTPLIIEIQYRTPEENEDAETHPDRAHDVYKERLSRRLGEVKHKAPVIEFVAHLIEWAVRGAEGGPPTNIRGYSCHLVD